MAERRMFTQTIIDSDAFLDMSLSTQSLYFHLGMRADDYGFINNPKKILRMIGANEDELKILIIKKFIISFENGIIVIKHWLIHNKLRQDRLKPTNYQAELSKLIIKDNGAYGILDGSQPLDNHTATNAQPLDRVGEDSIGEDSIGEDSIVTTSKSYDDALKISNYLYKHINKHNPSFKKPNFEVWAKDIDKAIRIDNRTTQQLKECIEWIYSEDGSFWKPNILSGKKLREKFDAMNMQSIKTKDSTNKSFKQQDRDQQSKEISYALEHNIFDLIEEIDKKSNDTITGGICE